MSSALSTIEEARRRLVIEHGPDGFSRSSKLCFDDEAAFRVSMLDRRGRNILDALEPMIEEFAAKVGVEIGQVKLLQDRDPINFECTLQLVARTPVAAKPEKRPLLDGAIDV